MEILYEYKPEYIVDKNHPLTLQMITLEKAKHLDEHVRNEFANLLGTIARSCKLINYHLRQAGLQNLYGYEEGDEGNASGEKRKKIDVISNDILKQQLIANKSVGVIASEEEDDVVVGAADGLFAIAFDPLDGSSNIDCNVTVGTIFSIWLRDTSKPPSQADFFRKGRELFASGYCVYGNSTLFVLAFNGEVNGFTQGDHLGDFILTHPVIKTKESFTNYSINEGNQKKWLEPTKEYINSKKNPEKGTAYSLRYIGSMVGDVHRTLLYGGIFLYPADKSSPKGKLRMLYECVPLSYVIECAGGASHDGLVDILDLIPTQIHQRTSIIMGSKLDVEDCRSFYKKHAAENK